jgi:rhodanese-related sulfurtransferase
MLLRASTALTIRPKHFNARICMTRMSSAQSRREIAAAAGGSSSSGPTAEVQHITVNELRELLSNEILADEVQFIDVREQWEADTASLPRFKLLPMSQASSWAPTVAEDLDPHAETVVMCHAGVRSMNAATVRDRCFCDSI